MKILKNSIFNVHAKKITIISLLRCLYIYICSITYAETVSNDISESVFRLHVIANSDSVEDQNLKYKVRDNLIKYMNSISANTSSKSEAIKIAKEHKIDFYNIAKQTIEDNGYTYDVEVSIGNYNFPTKKYGDISLPSGFYDALRVEIGNASGQNWWCVMFPPLCFVDVSSGIVPDDSKETIKNSLSNEEEYILLNQEQSLDMKLKFKLLEIFQNSKIQKAKN